MNISNLVRKWRIRKSIINQPNNLGYKLQTTNITGVQYFLIQSRENHIIPFTVTNYLTAYSRNGKSPHTIRNIGYALIYLYSFGEKLGTDINEIISNGETLEIKEITNLREFIRTTGSLQYDLNLTRSANLLSKQETNRLMKLILGYLKWGLEIYSKDPFSQLNKLEQKFNNLKYSLKTTSEIRVIEDSKIKDLETIFDFYNSSIWKNKTTALRNHCMFSLCLETGARISEILSLYVGDISTGAYATISIIKRDDNNLDHRKVKPRVKTTSRSIPISKTLHQNLIRYISQRSKTHRNPFLFLSHEGPNKGKGLSIRQAHAIMEKVDVHLKATNKSWSEKINWHDLRHTALYKFYWTYKDNPKQKELLQKIGGHISNSVFMRYHNLALMEEAQNLLADANEKNNSIPLEFDLENVYEKKVESIEDLI